MAISPQNYPRIEDAGNFLNGCLDDTQLVQHARKISAEEMSVFIRDAINKAEQKSGREILNIPDNAAPDDLKNIYYKAGKELFDYFRKYYGDPAATAFALINKHYKDVGVEQFKLRLLQKERMNSGWRYQFLAFECARHTGRFRSVSDIGSLEADFNAVVDINNGLKPLNLYVSIKNRSNTMGGQDWPKAIQALENIANADRNRVGPYLCVFGLAMQKSSRARLIKKKGGSNQSYSVNTEVWYANYFWPFFANYTYEEIMKFVLDILMELKRGEAGEIKSAIPDEVLLTFGNLCKEKRLINDDGIFDNPYNLLNFFCQSS